MSPRPGVTTSQGKGSEPTVARPDHPQDAGGASERMSSDLLLQPQPPPPHLTSSHQQHSTSTVMDNYAASVAAAAAAAVASSPAVSTSNSSISSSQLQQQPSPVNGSPVSAAAMVATSTAASNGVSSMAAAAAAAHFYQQQAAMASHFEPSAAAAALAVAASADTTPRYPWMSITGKAIPWLSPLSSPTPQVSGGFSLGYSLTSASGSLDCPLCCCKGRKTQSRSLLVIKVSQVRAGRPSFLRKPSPLSLSLSMHYPPPHLFFLLLLPSIRAAKPMEHSSVLDAFNVLALTTSGNPDRRLLQNENLSSSSWQPRFCRRLPNAIKDPFHRPQSSAPSKRRVEALSLSTTSSSLCA